MTELSPQEPAPHPGDAANPGADAPSRAFAGFRTERRVPATERREASPAGGDAALGFDTSARVEPDRL